MYVGFIYGNMVIGVRGFLGLVFICFFCVVIMDFCDYLFIFFSLEVFCVYIKFELGIFWFVLIL